MRNRFARDATTDIRRGHEISDLFERRAFHVVVDAGSFTAAARRLGVAPSTIARAIERLEVQLGATLFARSTHNVVLTEIGRAYHDHVAAWLDAEAAAVARIAGARGGATLLRVTLPVWFAEHVVPAAVRALWRQLPDARFEIHASDERADLIGDARDLAIRLGPLEDSSLRATQLVAFRTALVMASGQGARLREPGDSARVPVIAFGIGRGPRRWVFRKGRDIRAVAIEPKLCTSNLELIGALVAAGEGVALLPEPSVPGGTVRVLDGWTPYAGARVPAMYAVYRPDVTTARLRNAFIAALQDQIRSRWPTGTSSR